MGFFSPLFYFVGVGALLSFVALPIFGAADEPPTQVADRAANLDGLRGLLALSVVFHHASIYHGQLTTAHWLPPPSAFYNELGQASVGLFFVITAYLFWTKVMINAGRLDFVALLVSRAFRIGPVYLVATLIFIVANLWLDGFTLHIPAASFAVENLQRLALGLFDPGRINGHPSVILAGVTWTLPYEWRFYLLLPLLALIARLPRMVMPAALAGCGLVAVLFAEIGARDLALLLLFGGGIAWATIAHQAPLPEVRRPVVSILVIVLLAVVAAFQTPFEAVWPPLLLIAAFAGIMQGGDLFGLLRLRATRRLGDISYPLYLMHGPVLAAAFAFQPVRDAALGNPVAYWSIVIGIIAVALLVALGVHVAVEMPGMALGRHWVKRMRRGHQTAVRGASEAVAAARPGVPLPVRMRAD